MHRISLVHVHVGLGLALAAGCQVDGEAPTDYSQQALDCTDDAEACATGCLEAAGIDTAEIEACAAELESCVDADPGAAGACLDAAEECLGVDAAAAVEVLTECLATCNIDFGDCVPDPPDSDDLDDLVACAEAAAECLDGCAEDISECELPAVECDTTGQEALVACIEAAAGDPGAIAACAADALADVCEIQEVDLGCFEAGQACFPTCASDAEDCLGGS